MTISPKTTCLLALFHLCVALPGHAQNKEQVAVQFVAFPKIPDAMPVELVAGPGKTIEVELPTVSPSKVYTVERQAQWMVGKTETDAEGNPVFKSYGKAPVLAAKKQFILVVTDGKKYENGIKLIPMDADIKGFNGGDYLFFNATKIEIAAELGDKKLALKPNTHKIVTPKPLKNQKNGKVLPTYLYFRKGNEAQAFYSSNWRFNPKVRCFIFLYHDIHNQRLRTHSIRDYLP